MELAFAGLRQLCAPMLDHLDRLPIPQRDALATAFGLGAAAAADRFLVGLAVLSLLAEIAEEQPLVCLVDDAQWLDRASAQALAFVARRLLAESVALLFAVREPSELHELDGLPHHTIAGLRERDARVLLESSVPGRLDDRVPDRIVAESRGNPLALLELPRALSATELAGGYRRPDAQPLAAQIEQSFLRRIRTLPLDTRRLLLTAAAEPVGDVGTSVRFRHPSSDRPPTGPVRPTTASWCTARWPRPPTPRPIPIDGPGIAPMPRRRPTTPLPPTSSVRPTPLGHAAGSPPPGPCWPGPPS